jgi:hypothetical protein
MRKNRADWHWDRHLGSGLVETDNPNGWESEAGLMRAVAASLLAAADKRDAPDDR